MDKDEVPICVQPLQNISPEVSNSEEFRKDRTDLIVLKYMAQRMYLILQQLGQMVRQSRSFTYSFEEQRSATRNSLHRIAMYRCQELLLADTLAFVGFVSKKQKDLSQAVISDIDTIDQKLVVDLANTPGLLSYSSLELRHGNWCNLVVFQDVHVKSQIKEMTTHMHAAYRLAPLYYEWIRLHNGTMFGGLACQELRIEKTKYYTFQGTQFKPLIRELAYH